MPAHAGLGIIMVFTRIVKGFFLFFHVKPLYPIPLGLISRKNTICCTNWNGEVCLTASEVWFAPSEVCLTASEVATLWQLWCARSALIEIVGVADTFTFSVGENFTTK